jgi:hypothetical protein
MKTALFTGSIPQRCFERGACWLLVLRRILDIGKYLRVFFIRKNTSLKYRNTMDNFNDLSIGTAFAPHPIREVI